MKRVCCTVAAGTLVAALGFASTGACTSGAPEAAGEGVPDAAPDSRGPRRDGGVQVYDPPPANKPTYELTLVCGPSHPDCSEHEPCPALSTDDGGCGGDLPGLYGHPPIRLDGGRPVSCAAYLPYESPYYPSRPQPCICESPGRVGDAAVAEPPRWMCPL
jgi:hypothetical protein